MYSNATVHDLIQCIGGKSIALDPSKKISSISTDSRTLNKDDVFFAIRGENFDGHNFLKTALEKGAQLVVTEKQLDDTSPQLLVSDTMDALVKWGASLRNRFSGPVVAITGSAGKSSTKDMLAVLLGAKTLKSPASFNNLLGVSKTLCLVEDDTKRLVLEMGMNALGEIQTLAETFRPNFGLITNIGEAHMGKLGGVEGIYLAKKELFDYLAKLKSTLGVAINAEDALVLRACEESFGKNFLSSDSAVQYSPTGKLETPVRLAKSSIHPKTLNLDLEIKVFGESLSFSLPIFGEHQASNVVAAVALAKILGVGLSEMRTRGALIRPALHRGEILSSPQEKIWIDESYNSNPVALKLSLSTLAKLPIRARLVLVIGQMNELGEFAKQKHLDVASHLISEFKKIPSAVLYTVGPEAQVIHESVSRAMPGWKCHWYANVRELTEPFSQSLQAEDTIYLKGSNSLRLFDLIPKG